MKENTDKFIKSINKQIEFNQGKNIFAKDSDIFQFASETVKVTSKINGLNPDSIDFIADYATDKAIEEFCRVNQYYAFDSKTKDNLKTIYLNLFECILNKTDSIEIISKKHYESLKNWLKSSNSFAEKIYTNKSNEIEPVACSEYSPNLQIEILQINIKNLIQPVLDIGCGSQGLLVEFLESQDIDAHGIDRYKFENLNCETADWLEYDYENNKWGTIISNLGFSNHFNHHNLRNDGNYIKYAQTYMKILHSLKKNGCFHYAPDLPFIEKYLDNNQFALNKFDIDKYNFKTTIVKRL